MSMLHVCSRLSHISRGNNVGRISRESEIIEFENRVRSWVGPRIKVQLEMQCRMLESDSTMSKNCKL